MEQSIIGWRKCSCRLIGKWLLWADTPGKRHYHFCYCQRTFAILGFPLRYSELSRQQLLNGVNTFRLTSPLHIPSDMCSPDGYKKTDWGRSRPLPYVFGFPG
jgi:hypothetical protein